MSISTRNVCRSLSRKNLAKTSCLCLWKEKVDEKPSTCFVFGRKKLLKNLHHCCSNVEDVGRGKLVVYKKPRIGRKNEIVKTFPVGRTGLSCDNWSEIRCRARDVWDKTLRIWKNLGWIVLASVRIKIKKPDWWYYQAIGIVVKIFQW